VPAAIAAWRDPARDPELWIAALGAFLLGCLLTALAILALPDPRRQTRLVAFLCHVMWALTCYPVLAGQVPVAPFLRVAVLAAPAGLLVLILIRRQNLLPFAIAAQLLALLKVSLESS
jgi:hypothetical protein